MSQTRTASVTPLIRNKSDLEEAGVEKQASFPDCLEDIGADDQITVTVRGDDREVLACNGFQKHLSQRSYEEYEKYSHVSPVEMDPMLLKGKESVGTDSSANSSTTTCDLQTSSCTEKIEIAQACIEDFFSKHGALLKKILYGVLTGLYFAYFIWAVYLDYLRAVPLIALTSLLVLGFSYAAVRRKFWGKINSCWTKVTKPVSACLDGKKHILTNVLYVMVLICIVIYLVVEVGSRPYQFVSFAGIFVFLLLLFIFSKHPSKDLATYIVSSRGMIRQVTTKFNRDERLVFVDPIESGYVIPEWEGAILKAADLDLKVNFRPVIWGLVLQFMLGVVILRTDWGFSTFNFLGQQVQAFLSYSNFGAEFVFGELFMNHRFAFQVLPVIVFFSCAISVLYHIGVMQAVISRIAWVMEKTLKTAATESLTAASNIFVGQTEAPILVRPFIQDMTKSELHAMMTAGFATIAGSVLAAYILFGVPAEHLLGASVMNAPVALAVSKLFYPETEKSKTIGKNIELEKSNSRNLLEAASSGASAAISLVANIAANLIAFLAMLAFVNAVLSWLGNMVGHSELSFQLICGYVFMPIAFLMGVEWKDCGKVAELLGTKTFLNEFVAYEKLSEFISNRVGCVDTDQQISVRSETIATYALCGFANLSSVGIQLGGIGPMAPSRKGDLAELAIRALIAGTMACFITACLAGVLTPDHPFEGCNNSTNFNISSNYSVGILANNSSVSL